MSLIEKNNKLLRITTIPLSLRVLLKGQLRFMKENGFDVLGISSSGPELEKLAEDEDIRIYPIEMTREISPLKDLKSLILFYKLCRSERPVIVHSHTPKAGIISMLGSKLANVPIRLHTVAGLPLMEAKGFKWHLLFQVEKFTYRFATKVYPNSKGIYDFIVKHKLVPVDKLQIIANGSSNGIDSLYYNLNIFSIQEIQNIKLKLGIGLSDFVFIFVGRLVGDKGVNELVSAFSKLNFLNVKLILLGSFEFDLDPLNLNTISEIESNANIISVGYQVDVRPYLALSDCLVLPSYREGFPNAVMQAGSMGLPCIVTDINGNNEIILDGVNGVLVTPKDILSLRSAMHKIVEDKDFWLRLKSNSREMIVSRYSQKSFWSALLLEYQAVLRLL